jgi:hypothetical protein
MTAGRPTPPQAVSDEGPTEGEVMRSSSSQISVGLAIGLALALGAPAAGHAASNWAVPGSYVGQTSQQFPITLRLTQSGAVSFRLRKTYTCTGDGHGPTGDRPFQSTRTEGSGQAAGVLGDRIPLARLSSGNRVRSVLRSRVGEGDGDFLDHTITWDARFTSSRRISGTIKWTIHTFNGEEHAFVSTCSTPQIRFVASRLA